MGVWNGDITAGDFTMYATVYYQKAGVGVSGWRGEINNASAEEMMWANEIINVNEACETSIGSIMVKRISGQTISFVGSGAAKGPLEKAMKYIK